MHLYSFQLNLRLAACACHLLPIVLFVTACISTNSESNQVPLNRLEHDAKSSGIDLDSIEISEALRYLIHSFETLQSAFFSSDRGDYPTAIDWTAAVTQTHAVTSIHSVLLSSLPKNETSHFVNLYFPDVIDFYRTQNVGSLKYQAYDDMLWVVLGWLAAVRFLDAYYYLLPEEYNPDFYVWREDFALRAREFYGYAEKGWDELFCGGGCLWNPNLQPYKNAITNELFISASAQMYTTFPPEYGSPGGDKDASPDISYLQNAAKAYQWFKGSNFTNEAGLVVDGFHISSYWKRKCDQRDEQTFTYNQGVVLSGLRALWESTGKQEYLQDGYELIESVIGSDNKTGGLVRERILEEHCDSWGWCNQDAQTFKAFCSPHPYAATWKSDKETHKPRLDEHLEKCKTFFPFIAQNAEAAWSTRQINSSIFGMWWSAPLFENDPDFDHRLRAGEIGLQRDPAAVDLVNINRGDDWELGSTDAEVELEKEQKVDWSGEEVKGDPDFETHIVKRDLNDRFRGRTLETQTGGVGVMRAAWELGAL
ncbi:hypothetical protein ABW19_dt0206711 [Dactylella cylindrospora]|nr:hypothetical protein ABW19_dt0206711 [Dactylella cylindrospora]